MFDRLPRDIILCIAAAVAQPPGPPGPSLDIVCMALACRATRVATTVAPGPPGCSALASCSDTQARYALKVLGLERAIRQSTTMQAAARAGCTAALDALGLIDAAGYSRLLQSAAAGGSRRSAEYLLKRAKQSNIRIDAGPALRAAAGAGAIDFLIAMRRHGHRTRDISALVRCAASGGRVECLRWLRETQAKEVHGFRVGQWRGRGVARAIVEGGDERVLDFFLSTGIGAERVFASRLEYHSILRDSLRTYLLLPTRQSERPRDNLAARAWRRLAVASAARAIMGHWIASGHHTRQSIVAELASVHAMDDDAYSDAMAWLSQT
jgi:hypothetical protein